MLDCAVVGASHETLGEVPIAFVVPDGTAPDVEAVRAFCADTLSSYNHPHDIVTVEAIPRTGSGKIIRFQLRERYEGKSQPA